MFKMFFERINNKFGRIREEFGFTGKKAEYPNETSVLSNNKFKFFRGRFSNIISELKCSCRKINPVGTKSLCKGIAVLEAALCIPVVMYLIFFTLEVLRVGIYQVAVDGMALKLAFEYSGLKSSTNFEKVINDSKLAFFKSMDGIYCRIHVFPDLKSLVKSEKMNESPQWENISTPSIRYSDDMIPETTSGCAFIVTISYKFPFSSELVKKLFAGDGNNFLLWGRSINVCS